MKARVLCAFVFCVAFALGISAQRVAILRDVQKIQVTPTIVPNPAKVTDDFAATLVQDALRNALRQSNFEVGDAPIRAHFVLEEYSSGSMAKRLVVGMGAGRSTIAGRLVFEDADSRELVNVPLRVRGNVLFSPYQGGDTQLAQATASFDRKLLEEIARLRPARTVTAAAGTVPTAVASAEARAIESLNSEGCPTIAATLTATPGATLGEKIRAYRPGSYPAYSDERLERLYRDEYPCLSTKNESTPASATTPTTPPSSITNTDVISLHTAGFSDDFIIAKIHASSHIFTVQISDLLELKKAGISERVIQTMLEK
jgi:hypothetical protein